MTSRLTVDNLRAGYGKAEVLKGVSFELEDGEVLAVVGANGAGKSTLLRAVSGLLPVSSGRIGIESNDVTSAGVTKILKSGLAHVPENRLVFAELTVADNLKLGGWAHRKTPERVRADLDRIKDLFPRLSERWGQAAGNLSGGEQQMLAVGRGLMARPNVLLLDEPSLGLAPIVTGEILSAIRRLSRDEGLAVLIVEQNVAKVLDFSDRGMVMDRGAVVLEGSAAELLQSPDFRSAYFGVNHDQN